MNNSLHFDTLLPFPVKSGILIITRHKMYKMKISNIRSGKEGHDMGNISSVAGNGYYNSVSQIASGTKLGSAADGGDRTGHC